MIPTFQFQDTIYNASHSVFNIGYYLCVSYYVFEYIICNTFIHENETFGIFAENIAYGAKFIHLGWGGKSIQKIVGKYTFKKIIIPEGVYGGAVFAQ